MARTVVRARVRKYVRNHATFQGALASPRLAAAARSVAREFVRGPHLMTAALIGEMMAAGHYIPPGWVTQAYVRPVPKVTTYMHPYLTTTHGVVPRWAARIELSQEYGGNEKVGDEIYTRSDLPTLEFGSRYNERTKGDRPALKVLARAARLYAGTAPGVRSKMTKVDRLQRRKGDMDGDE